MFLMALLGSAGYRINGGWLGWLFAPLGKKLPQRLLWATIAGCAAFVSGAALVVVSLTAVGGFAGCWVPNDPALRRPAEFDWRSGLLTAAGGAGHVALLVGSAVWWLSLPLPWLAALVIGGGLLRLAVYRACWLIPVPAGWLGADNVPVDDHPAWAELGWGALQISAVLLVPTLTA